MGMTSAAEANLDARVRPQIVAMRSRTPYPRRRPVEAAQPQAASEPEQADTPAPTDRPITQRSPSVRAAVACSRAPRSG